MGWEDMDFSGWGGENYNVPISNFNTLDLGNFDIADAAAGAQPYGGYNSNLDWEPNGGVPEARVPYADQSPGLLATLGKAGTDLVAGAAKSVIPNLIGKGVQALVGGGGDKAERSSTTQNTNQKLLNQLAQEAQGAFNTAKGIQLPADYLNVIQKYMPTEIANKATNNALNTQVLSNAIAGPAKNPELELLSKFNQERLGQAADPDAVKRYWAGKMGLTMGGGGGLMESAEFQKVVADSMQDLGVAGLQENAKLRASLQASHEQAIPNLIKSQDDISTVQDIMNIMAVPAEKQAALLKTIQDALTNAYAAMKQAALPGTTTYGPQQATQGTADWITAALTPSAKGETTPVGSVVNAVTKPLTDLLGIQV